jgi:glycosyltransferase involved in cell wall biosynthesis
MKERVDAATAPELVSVVMPCFNAKSFVEQAVRSALGQDYGNVELIVVDDGSSDGSRDVLARLAREYGSRMTILNQEHQGPFPARNAALRRARGTLIAFLDADDYWARDCIGKLQRALQAAQADLAYCGWQNVGDGGPGKEPCVTVKYEAEDTVVQFLKGCPWPIHAALVRRSVLEEVGGFSTRMFSAMDYDLWLKILAVTRNFVQVPEVLAFYRWHDQGQISAVKWRQVLDSWQVRRDFARDHPEQVAHLSPGALRELVDGAVLQAGYAAYWKRDLVSAQRLFRKAARRGYWRLRDARYVLPSLLPAGLYRRLIESADRR